MTKQTYITLSLQRRAEFIGQDFVEIRSCYYSKRNLEYMLKQRDSWRAMQPNDQFELVRIKRTIKYTKL